MINHVRTLILNRSADTMSAVSGSVYIDPGFRRVDVPESLLFAESLLFSDTANDAEREVKVNAVMRILHCPDLERYVLVSDPRLTYSTAPATSSSFFETEGVTAFVLGFCSGARQFAYPMFEAADSGLLRIWNTADEPVLVFGSAVLAYAGRLGGLMQ